MLRLLLLVSLAACSPSIAGSGDDDVVPGDDDDDGGDDDTGPDAGVDDGPRPNIVYIVVDDLDYELMESMPKTRALVRDEGVELEGFFATYSLCTPSRVSVLTGLYPHNSRVTGNAAPEGGHGAFHDRGAEASTIAVWLKDGGYKTAMIGKYVNQYPAHSVGPNYKPPGWTDWYVLVRNVYGFFDFEMVENGHRVHYGTQASDYSTDVIARKTNALIQAYEADDDRPFFLYVSPTAPHSPAVSAPRHAGMFGGKQLPADPAFDEADVSDKPPWIQAKPRISAAAKDSITLLHRKRLRSIQAIDDLVEKVVAKLTATGELDRTIIVFTSDNGFHRGQHRLATGKTSAYEEDIRLPLYVRGPGIPAGQVRPHLALTIDLAPTLADFARVTAPVVDGVSLRPVLRATPIEVSAWRQDFLVVNRPGGEASAPRIDAVRSSAYKYIESGASAKELYDLAADPHELASAHASKPAIVAERKVRLTELLACSGADCF